MRSGDVFKVVDILQVLIFYGFEVFGDGCLIVYIMCEVLDCAIYFMRSGMLLRRVVNYFDDDGCELF